MTARIITGDCREVLKTLDADSIDACVCDPPYGLEFMGKEWDRLGATVEYPADGEGPWGRQNRVRYGANAKSMQAWHETWAREVYRVLKPGAHLLAFSGTRTSHRMVCAIEDAGFEIRDCLMWLYGSGFPKSLDVSKALDKRRDDDIEHVRVFLRAARDRHGLTNRQIANAFGFTPTMASHWIDHPTQPTLPTWPQWLALKELLSFDDDMDAEAWRLNGRKGKPGEAWFDREITGTGTSGKRQNPGWSNDDITSGVFRVNQDDYDITAPATDLARQWDGWGTALKPAYEPIILARKPLRGTVAANVTAYGTGAINVDGCRIEGAPRTTHVDGDHRQRLTSKGVAGGAWGNADADLGPNDQIYAARSARWPANVLLSHHPDCVEVGTKRVKGNGHHPKARGMGGLGTAGHGGQDGLEERYAKDETVSAWNCHPDCPVALLDAQSGERPSRAGSTKPTAESSWFLGAAQDGVGYGSDTGGASRFFKVVKHDSFTYNDNDMEGDTCGNELTKDVSTSVGKKTESRNGNLPTDGHGSKQTGLFPTDTKSIISTKTCSTTTSVTSNALPLDGMTITTNGGERTIESLTALSSDGASDAKNTNHLNNSADVLPGLITATARPVNVTTSESGENETENITTPICAPDDSVRFRYTAKADRAERNKGLEGMPEVVGKRTQDGGDDTRGRPLPVNQNVHPCVKPVDLMQWLVRLVTPKGGTVLDPFTGSGSTGIAADREGMDFIGIEQDPEYAEIARRRIVGDCPLFANLAAD